MTAPRIESVSLSIDGPAGRLEAMIERIADEQARFACVVCHPDPLQQGTMQNKVVTTIARSVARSGGASLRFNYRGVGKSDGSYDGKRGELEDALAALRHTGQLFGPAVPVCVAGFSFGGAIAYRVAAEADLDALVTVAPAWERIPADTRTEPPRWLLIQGDDDEIIPAEGVLAWARSHVNGPRVENFATTGHFFHGRLPQLADAVSLFFATRENGQD